MVLSCVRFAVARCSHFVISLVIEVARMKHFVPGSQNSMKKLVFLCYSSLRGLVVSCGVRWHPTSVPDPTTRHGRRWGKLDGNGLLDKYSRDPVTRDDLCVA